jgi:glycosyltransferase involved in cell wall biosynthesis/2-polyprenyl-3-methyl-5-hydroxy-6-metoxy-1,4-benzoquinol methylase
MKVTVSCAGRFHSFELIEQLEKRGHLHKFLTTTLNDSLLPNRKLPASLEKNVAFQKKVIEIPSPEYIGYAIRKLLLSNRTEGSYLAKDNLYDRAAASRIDRSDIFVGWSHQSLFQLREAKSRGAKTIIERGSTHIEYQQEVLDIERKRIGLPTLADSSVQSMIRDKQLKEYHECDYIMVPSEFARKTFIDRGFAPAKILKNPYGTDLSRFHPFSGREFLKDGTLKVLCVAPIGVQKGSHVLLEAVSALRKQGKKIHLTLIGQIEPEFKQWLNTSNFRSAIDRHIEFVENLQLLDHYHLADVFCLPSIQEGLALVLAEAIASGLPVIASDRTGAEELITHGQSGWIVPAADTNALMAALKEASESREVLVQYAASATDRIQQFSWDSYGERAVAHYEQILDASTSTEGQNFGEFYDEYWKRDTNWTPSHSFTDQQLELHFDDLLKPTDDVLDVGCGDASNYQTWLIKQVGKLTGMDISESGITAARRIGMEAVVHDFSKSFPFESDRFDKAVCIEVLEHLYDPKFCVQEIYRVLKPGGWFIMSVPNNGYHRERLKSLVKAELSTSITDLSNEWKGAHIRFYNQRSITKMLEVAGFKVEDVHSNGDSSIFDSLDAFGGYFTQHATTALRRNLPGILKLQFLEDVWPSLFAPHLIVWASKPTR